MTKEQELSETTGMKIIEKNEIIKVTEVAGTPFKVIKTDEGCFVALGKFRLSELLEEDEAIRQVMQKDWELLMSVVSVIVESIINNQNLEK